MGITRLSSIKLNKREINKNNSQTLTQLLISNPPWAKYKGSSYSNNVLPDESGNGRNAVCSGVVNANTVNNGGGTIPLPVCRGTATSSIIFPVGSIPTGDYTIAFITRYSGGSTNRVLCGNTSQNFILGHHSSKRGVFFDGTVWNSGKTVNIASGNIPDWLSMCVSRATVPPDNVIVNGLSKGYLNIPSNTTFNQLCINNSSFIEKSSFELSQLIIWNTSLTPIQVKVITDAFSNYLITGVIA